MWALKLVLGLICGCAVGGVLAYYLTMEWAYRAQRLSPHDPSAGAVAIMVIFTVPLGAIIGAQIGAVVAVVWENRRRIGSRAEVTTSRQQSDESPT